MRKLKTTMFKMCIYYLQVKRVDITKFLTYQCGQVHNHSCKKATLTSTSTPKSMTASMPILHVQNHNLRHYHMGETLSSNSTLRFTTTSMPILHVHNHSDNLNHNDRGEHWLPIQLQHPWKLQCLVNQLNSYTR